MENMEDMEDLEKLREKEFAERIEKIQNTISRFRKIACILAVITAVFMFFHARNDYNNYAGSQLVTAEVIKVESADNKNINVAYRYNIAGKEYESDKIQYTEKIRKGDKKEIRVKKNNPKVILNNDINYVVFCDVMIGLCLGLTVLCLYEMATCTLPSAVEEVKAKSVGFTTKRGVTFASIVEENKKKNEKNKKATKSKKGDSKNV